MENNIIKIRELEKKLGRFQDIPRGNAEMAYVFFQSEDNSKYSITTENRKIMSAELRNGRYDRIMEIQRGWFSKNIYKEISCKETGHFFTVDLDVGYYIADPEYIYLNRTYSISAELERVLSSIEGDFGDEYSYTKQAELSREMRQLIEKKLGELPYLKYSIGLQMDVDEGARDLLDRQIKHEIAVDRIDKEAIEERHRTRNEEELKQMKMDQMKKYIDRFGVNAGNLLSHVDGELSGRELSEIMKADRKQQTETNFEMLMRLYKEGIINDVNVGEMMGKILPGIEQAKPSEQIEEKPDSLDEEEYGEDKSFQWKKS